MSRQGLNQLLGDIVRDATEWQRDPESFIGRYDLNSEERQAVTSGDEQKLRDMGVEDRLTKAIKANG